MKYLKIFILLIFISSSIFGKESEVADENKEELKGSLELTIFFTNDTNGHPINFSAWGQDGMGGLPARASLIKKLIGDDKNKHYLILDSGGIIGGRPESNLYDGLTDIEGMNAIEYDAAGVGTSEIRESGRKFKLLNSKADFYFLSSNIKDKNGDEICDKYWAFKLGGAKGVKIGIFSVTNDDVATELSKTANEDFVIKDPIETAKEMVEELKSNKNKADIIIALTYMGYYPDGSKIGSRSLANSVNGIDIIIDGRTGLKLDEPVVVGNTRICQAYKWGLFVGEITLIIDNGKIADFKYKLHPVNYKEEGNLVGELIKEDEKVLKKIEKKMPRFEKTLEKTIAEMKEGKFDTEYVRFKETELGNLICDAVLDYSGADIAFQNAGGIGDVVIEAGDLSRKSFDDVIKYDNSIVLVNMSGEQVLKMLEYSIDKMGHGAFLQVGGIKFKYSKSKNEFSDVTVKGIELDKTKIYKIAINSWMANGGDGYIQFRDDANKVDLNMIHREAVYDYLSKMKLIEPILDGRMVIVE